MKTEIITEENISRYLEVLSNEEIFKLSDSEVTCFGAYDEDTGQGLGTLSAEILPEYIRINRLYVSPEKRGKKVGTLLMDAATNLPDGMDMPIYVFGTERDINDGFLKACGFIMQESAYSYIEGRLSDLIDLPLPQKKDGYRFLTLNDIPKEAIIDFVISSEGDDFRKAADLFMNLEGFSEGSPVCMSGGEVVALLLFEEKDDCVSVQYVRGDDNKGMLYTFSVLKKMLIAEYSKELIIRFLDRDGKNEAAFSKILKKNKKTDLRIYKKEGQNE